jgi:hypothetical protein
VASEFCRQILVGNSLGRDLASGLRACVYSPSQDLPDLPKARDPLEAARNGYTFYKHLQSHDGHWPGEYGGPMFLLPGLVIGSYVSGMHFKEEERLELVRYLFNRANPEDGGWGMYVRLRVILP